MNINTERIVYIAKRIESLIDFKEELEDGLNTLELRATRKMNETLLAERLIPLNKRLKQVLILELESQITEQETKLQKQLLDGFAKTDNL